MAFPHVVHDIGAAEAANSRPGSETQQANRRRLLVFLGVFVITATAGLIWDVMRPAQYRAVSRLQITPTTSSLPSIAPSSTGNSGANEAAQPFLVEVQTLTSRPLLERVSTRMRNAGHDLDALGPDPILGLQSSLTVTPLAGTNVVELAAVGAVPELPAALLVGISDVYREQILRDYKESASEATAQVIDETTKLEEAVAAKRSAVEEYRVRNNIVSPEREENDVLAEVRGLTQALKEANQRIAEAEGKASALRDASAGGKGVVRARDDPTLANLEQRASQIRESLRDMARTFTPTYLEIDPQARALRARLAELESQIKVQREVGQRNALSEAEEDLAGAREAARSLQAQIASGRQRVGQFTARFSQYKSLQTELGELEKAYQEALQRKARLEATERSRMPSMQVLEQAALPREVWRPLYWRDAGIVGAGSLLLALLAMWLVELFNRSEPKPSVVVTQPVLAGALMHSPHGLTPAEPMQRHLTVEQTPLLAQPQSMPRELRVDEVQSLLRSADRDTRIALTLLLSGASPEEALQLRWRDIDTAAGVLQVGGANARSIEIGATTLGLPGQPDATPDEPMLRGQADGGASTESLAAQLFCAAHDAGVERPDEVTPAALRHTYIAYLVRQGIRFADLTRRVGPLPAELLSAYSALAPSGPRVASESVQQAFPAFANRELS